MTRKIHFRRQPQQEIYWQAVREAHEHFTINNTMTNQTTTIQTLLTEKAKYILDESYYCTRDASAFGEGTMGLADFTPAWEEESCIEVAKETIVETMKEIHGGIILDALNAYFHAATKRLEKPYELGTIEKRNFEQQARICAEMIDFLK